MFYARITQMNMKTLGSYHESNKRANRMIKILFYEVMHPLDVRIVKVISSIYFRKNPVGKGMDGYHLLSATC